MGAVGSFDPRHKVFAPALLLLAEAVHHAARDSEKLSRLGAEMLQNEIRRQPQRQVLRAVEVDARAHRPHRFGAIGVQPDVLARRQRSLGEVA
jgi:hypothetical protein